MDDIPAVSYDDVRMPRAVALVPAYNEEDIIERTIRSLWTQTYAFEYILVIANNCRDRTVEIVQNLQEEFGHEWLRLLVMENNRGLKAGALNYGFQHISPDMDYVFSMDADTIVDVDLLEVGIWKLEHEPQTGGVCSSYRTLPLKEIDDYRQRPSAWKKFLWRLQNIEFSLANAWRFETHWSARVLPGVSTLYRMETLCEVAGLHEDGHPWVVNNRVEDYILTLEIKDLGWDAKSSHDMVSWSDVPLSPRVLWKQRERWYSGTVDVIRQRGIVHRHNRYESFTIGLLVMNLIMRFTLVGAYLALIFAGIPIEWASPFLALPVIASIMQTWRLWKCGDQQDKWQYIFTVTLVVNEAYAMWREALYAYSVWLSYFRPNRGW